MAAEGAPPPLETDEETETSKSEGGDVIGPPGEPPAENAEGGDS